MHTKTIQLQKARLMKSIAFGSCLHGENMYKSYRLNKLTLLSNILIQQKLFIAVTWVLFMHVWWWTKLCTAISVWQIDQCMNVFLASPHRLSSKLESQNELCQGDQVSKQWILILEYTNTILHNMPQKDTSAQESAGQHEKFTTDVRIMLQCGGGRKGVRWGGGTTK